MTGAPITLVARDACPVCAGPVGAPLVDLPYDAAPIDAYLQAFYGGAIDPTRLAGERYRLIECGRCGLIYQRDVPDGAFLTELYDEVLVHDEAALRERRGLAERRRYAQEVESLLRWWGLPPAQVRVLDHGAGYSLWLQMAAAYGCATAATELSQDKLDRAATAGHEAYAIDALPAASFHHIISNQVFEHVVEPVVELQRLADALVPGGIVQVEVPSAADIGDRLRAPDWQAPKEGPRSLNAVAPLEHLNCYQHATLVRLGTSVGLEVFTYPLRHHLHANERLRTLAGAFAHRLRPPRGALVRFRKAP